MIYLREWEIAGLVLLAVGKIADTAHSKIACYYAGYMPHVSDGPGNDVARHRTGRSTTKGQGITMRNRMSRYGRTVCVLALSCSLAAGPAAPALASESENLRGGGAF